VVIGKHLPKVPILMYTLYKSLQLDASAKNAGIRKVVSKSDPEALLQAAAALLGNNHKTAFGGRT
jgi:CheY-like chemotaxis protein